MDFGSQQMQVLRVIVFSLRTNAINVYGKPRIETSAENSGSILLVSRIKITKSNRLK